MESEAQQRFSWTGSALYRELCETFPTIRTRQQNVLDVELLADKIGMTKEGLYKWLRAGRILSKRGVERIVALANEPEYAAALTDAGRTPPTKQDLARFLLS